MKKNTTSRQTSSKTSKGSKQTKSRTSQSSLSSIPEIKRVSAAEVPQYAPFIRAAENMGGLDRTQLRKVHRYAHCVLATQRHKLDLSSFRDNYFSTEKLPSIPETFPYLNVTSMRDPVTLFNKSIADALSIIPTIEAIIPEIHDPVHHGVLTTPAKTPIKIVDVGSGGGVPGMILAIARPDWQITMVDSVNKKCHFLRHVADCLHLKNVTVISGGVQTYTLQQGAKAKPIPSYIEPYYVPRTQENPFLDRHSHIDIDLTPPTQETEVDMFETYDICVARGVTAMPNLLPLCLPLVRPGGKFIAMKALLASVRLDLDQQQLITEMNEKIKQGQTATPASEKTDENETMMDENNDDDVDTIPSTDANTKKTKRKKLKVTGPTRDIQIKVQQQQHNESLTDFNQHLDAIIHSKWVPQGEISPHFSKISLELAQGLPLLKGYGAGESARYVHTDPFFSHVYSEDAADSVQKQKKAPTKDEDQSVDDDDDDDSNSNDHSMSMDDMLHARQKQQQQSILDKKQHGGQINDNDDESTSNDGDAARYLCIIDKVSTFPLDAIPRSKNAPKKTKAQGPSDDARQYLRQDSGNNEQNDNNNNNNNNKGKGKAAATAATTTADESSASNQKVLNQAIPAKVSSTPSRSLSSSHSTVKASGAPASKSSQQQDKRRQSLPAKDQGSHQDNKDVKKSSSTSKSTQEYQGEKRSRRQFESNHDKKSQVNQKDSSSSVRVKSPYSDRNDSSKRQRTAGNDAKVAKKDHNYNSKKKTSAA